IYSFGLAQPQTGWAHVGCRPASERIAFAFNVLPQQHVLAAGTPAQLREGAEVRFNMPQSTQFGLKPETFIVNLFARSPNPGCVLDPMLPGCLWEHPAIECPAGSAACSDSAIRMENNQIIIVIPNGILRALSTTSVRLQVGVAHRYPQCEQPGFLR